MLFLAGLAILLPSLYWDHPVDTAAALRQAGIARILVPAAQVDAWRKAGFTANAFDPATAAKATAPHVEYQMDVASATRVPWVDANGWQFIRTPSRTYFYDAPAGAAAMAAAEAYAYGVQAVIQAAPEDVDSLGRMLRFLGNLDAPRLPTRANFGIIDDGSDEMGEVMNLMARHNLLFDVIPSPDPAYDLIVRLGAGGFTKEDIADPYAFAIRMRHQLTDDKRLVRIYGSNVVIVRLTGDSTGEQVHLLDYGKPEVKALHVRVLGSYPQHHVAVFGHPRAALEDFSVAGGATEFTIPELGPYAIVYLGNGQLSR
ncbi:MAG TPA: hypothetical protein VMU80_02345 [Bryobacteraceae bacterium]|nr:hypothetical protein [Bryobacteraceae bacterium]